MTESVYNPVARDDKYGVCVHGTPRGEVCVECEDVKRAIPRYPGEIASVRIGDVVYSEKTDGDVASSVCEEAAKIVAGRSDTHGAKERSFEAIAQRWSNHIHERYGIDVVLTANDVAHMQIELKLARANHGKRVRDHYVDIAGYGGLAHEVDGGE